MSLTSAWSSCPHCGKALFKDDYVCKSCDYQLSEVEKKQAAFEIDRKHKIGIIAGIIVFGLAAFLIILMMLW